MQKLMTVSHPGDLRARVEIWLEHARSRSGVPQLHAVSYQGQRELQRRSVRLSDEHSEPLGVSARRVCQEVCSGMGWPAAQWSRG
jgi:hypothetical protein